MQGPEALDRTPPGRIGPACGRCSLESGQPATTVGQPPGVQQGAGQPVEVLRVCRGGMAGVRVHRAGPKDGGASRPEPTGARCRQDRHPPQAAPRLRRRIAVASSPCRPCHAVAALSRSASRAGSSRRKPAPEIFAEEPAMANHCPCRSFRRNTKRSRSARGGEDQVRACADGQGLPRAGAPRQPFEDRRVEERSRPPPPGEEKIEDLPGEVVGHAPRGVVGLQVELSVGIDRRDGTGGQSEAWRPSPRRARLDAAAARAGRRLPVIIEQRPGLRLDLKPEVVAADLRQIPVQPEPVETKVRRNCGCR